MQKRIYLVIIDETEEAQIALRFASRRAAAVSGAVHILAIIPKQPMSAFAGVQATIEDEAKARAETLATAAAGNLLSQGGSMPSIAVRMGDAVKVVQQYLTEHPEISTLVLGAAHDGPPGPLISHFTGLHAGRLPCPIFIVPGGLSDEALDRVS